MKDGLLYAVVWFVVFALPMSVLRVVLALVGIFVVPVALLFAHTETSPVTRRYTGWQYKRLPFWAWIWDNETYGTMGNHHWQEARYNPLFYKKPASFWSQWYWLAIRNPTNNMAEWALSSLDLRETSKVFWVGAASVDNYFPGWQFVWAKKGIVYYPGIYGMQPIPFTGRALELRLGFKLKPEDNDSEPDRRVGLTFIINPFKKNPL